ncbi:unnamed protein product [Sphenostylis stenocarpa]|uniref:Uncharacterized protein n=1 Tax=Sphenostylis stenocarpa TaxID=92480 RepID=A0AA86RYL8_9FABA|nr:unnamed protein product [Sphenostylis stenocarpa]
MADRMAKLVGKMISPNQTVYTGRSTMDSIGIDSLTNYWIGTEEVLAVSLNLKDGNSHPFASPKGILIPIICLGFSGAFVVEEFDRWLSNFVWTGDTYSAKLMKVQANTY